MASWSLPCGPLVSSVSHALRRHTVSFSCFLFFFCKSVSTVAQLCLTLCNPMDWSTPGLPVHHQPPEFTQTHVYWVSDAIQPSHPLLSPSPPTFNLSQHQGLFKWVLHIRWPKYCNFSFSISPSNEYSGLISFRIDWLDLLVVQETLKSFSNTTVKTHQFFGAQLSL